MASPMVAVEDAEDMFRPLVLDTVGRLYLHRYWDYEVRLSQRLRELNTPIALTDVQKARELLDRLFPNPERLDPDWQKVAAAIALTRRLCVISGGPGTGKTTTVVKVLAVLLTLDPTLRIALAAPTGKAAARLQESIRRQAASLPVSPEIIARMPQEPHTLHRLLRYQPGRVGFRHNRDNPLPYDVVIVDEASMLDLAMAAKLSDAVMDGARLILLGDKDQLASVETGSVFADICRNRSITPTGAELTKTLTGFDIPSGGRDGSDGGGLSDAIVLLNRSYRFSTEGGIGKLAQQINKGDGAAALDTLRIVDGPEVSWVNEAPETEALADRLFEGYATFVDAVKSASSPEKVLKAFEAYRALCAVKESAQGTRRINEAIERRMRATLDDSGNAGRWFHGRPVIVTANDYLLKLYNGDIGVALMDAAGELTTYFPNPDGSVRAVAPGRLTSCETAFAMTVHKSQGSEFDSVDVVLTSAENRVLTRELLYTAITRARTRIRVWGRSDVVKVTISRRTERLSGLADRILQSL